MAVSRFAARCRIKDLIVVSESIKGLLKAGLSIGGLNDYSTYTKHKLFDSKHSVRCGLV